MPYFLKKTTYPGLDAMPHMGLGLDSIPLKGQG